MRGLSAKHPVKPRAQKYFSLSEFGIGVYADSSHPVRGAVVRRHETWVGMRWTQAASARRQSQGGVLGIEPGPVSDRHSRTTNGADAYGKTVWSWLSLLQSSFRGDASTQPGLMYRQSAKRRRQNEFVSGESTP